MDDLISWLRDQIDDDERAARSAGGDKWIASGLAFVDDSSGHAVVSTERMDSGVQAHIARHNPARVLAEVEAKRRILDKWQDPATVERFPDGVHDGRDWDEREAQVSRARTIDRLVRLLALPYADRPGYQSEWAPPNG